MNAVTAATNTTNINYTKNEENNNTSVDNSLFSNLLNNKTEPKKITYNEYKNLTVEDINKLYPKDSMPNENAKAISLHTRVNGTKDEILNKVLFDDAIESNETEFEKSTDRGIDSLLTLWEDMNQFKLAWDKTKQYLKDNNIKIKPTKDGFSQSDMEFIAQVHSETYKETVVPENLKKMTAEELFHSFECTESYYDVIMDFNNYTTESDYYKDSRKSIIYHNKIQGEYEKRVEEKDALLEQLTKNNKPNPIESLS